jgi:transposase
MKFIQGQDRDQAHLFPTSLDQAIETDNVVRVIDMFVDHLNLEEFGFKTIFPDNGRPAYHPADLLKLFIYGYMNRIRSSRELEKECKRNIEIMWLIRCLKPDHNTIANFRRDNPKAIKKVFRSTVQIAKQFNLIGGMLMAGDSTKFRAQNSKKNNFNQNKINRHIAYIDHKLEQYHQQLAGQDGDEKEQTKKDIDKHNQRKDHYRKLENKLKETGQEQVSTSDPESRQMIIRNNITEVAYNVQACIDDKHCLPFDYKVTNNNDSKAMGNMLQRAKAILGKTPFIALFDKGYHTGSELHAAERLGITTLVAVPAIPRSSQSPDPKFNVENFTYSPTDDTYTCPVGEELRSTGTWYQGKNYRFKQYKTTACRQCHMKERCTRSHRNGKMVQRSEFTPAIERNRERVKKHEKLYRKRQAIVEHPFGTIKRQWGFCYIITKKGKQRASADVGLMFIAYNLKRVINIVGIKALMDYFQGFCVQLSAKITAQIRFKRLTAMFRSLKTFLAGIFEKTVLQVIFIRNIKLSGGF